MGDEPRKDVVHHAELAGLLLQLQLEDMALLLDRMHGPLRCAIGLAVAWGRVLGHGLRCPQVRHLVDQIADRVLPVRANHDLVVVPELLHVPHILLHRKAASYTFARYDMSTDPF